MRIVCFESVHAPAHHSRSPRNRHRTSYVRLCQQAIFVFLSLSALLFLGLLIFTEGVRGQRVKRTWGTTPHPTKVSVSRLHRPVENMINAGKTKHEQVISSKFASQIKNFNWKHISIRPDFLNASFQLLPNCDHKCVFRHPLFHRGQRYWLMMTASVGWKGYNMMCNHNYQAWRRFRNSGCDNY